MLVTVIALLIVGVRVAYYAVGYPEFVSSDSCGIAKKWAYHVAVLAVASLPGTNSQHCPCMRRNTTVLTNSLASVG